MISTIPVFVQVSTLPGWGDEFNCIPLFWPSGNSRNKTLGKALAHLRSNAKRYLEFCANSGEQDRLARALFSPSTTIHSTKCRLEHKSASLTFQLFYVTYRIETEEFAQIPIADNLTLRLKSELPHEPQVQQALQSWTNKKLQKRTLEWEAICNFAKVRDAWTTTVDVGFRPDFLPNKDSDNPFAFLFVMKKIEGAHELALVGRCLSQQYPEDLERAYCREREADELTRLLHAEDRRPILVVGPRMVGKTNLIHEATARKMSSKKRRSLEREAVWSISPQRLITGMSYCGEWETRLNAILKHAHLRNHAIVFDNLLGLFQAGVSQSSRLSVGDVLRRSAMRGEVQILSEATWDQFQLLQERDRAFADAFHVVSLQSLDAETSTIVAISTMRDLENQFECNFSPEIISHLLALTERFGGDAAFPGKAIGLIRQLSRLLRGKAIGLKELQELLAHNTGLAIENIQLSGFSKANLVESIAKRLIGQPEAISKVAEVITNLFAGLQDPEKPAGSFLFLGPTGIGKTECAKVMADVLYQDESRLIRFDMNEFKTANSAARLRGTPDQPEGLLTSSVKRFPFSVLLFDEIEKGHPDVHDILLQVLGEGRLTDHWGETIDCRNCLVVLTSNLGATEQSKRISISDSDENLGHGYVKAAERFFRPEFFNRIDHIVPFRSLSVSDALNIVQLAAKNVLNRAGLLRRNVFVVLDKSAIEEAAAAGFDPKYGARSLKRYLEDQLAQPVAEVIASKRTDHGGILRVAKRAEGFSAEMIPFQAASPTKQLVGLEETIEYFQYAIDWTRAQIDQLISRTKSNSLRTEGDLRHAQRLREFLIDFRHEALDLRDTMKDISMNKNRDIGSRGGSRGSNYVFSSEFFQDESLRDYVEDIADNSRDIDWEERRDSLLIQFLSYKLQVDWLAVPAPDNEFIVVRCVSLYGATHSIVDRLVDRMHSLLTTFGVNAERVSSADLGPKDANRCIEAVVITDRWAWPLVQEIRSAFLLEAGEQDCILVLPELVKATAVADRLKSAHEINSEDLAALPVLYRGRVGESVFDYRLGEDFAFDKWFSNVSPRQLLRQFSLPEIAAE